MCLTCDTCDVGLCCIGTLGKGTLCTYLFGRVPTAAGNVITTPYLWERMCVKMLLVIWKCMYCQSLRVRMHITDWWLLEMSLWYYYKKMHVGLHACEIAPLHLGTHGTTLRVGTHVCKNAPLRWGTHDIANWWLLKKLLLLQTCGNTCV